MGPSKRQTQTLQTQTWKQLNDRVYWALSAAEKARNGEYEEASKYSEWSVQAMVGITSGYPEVDIPIPEMPRPAEANPQVKLYNLVIEETSKLIPVFQRTDKKIIELTELKKKTEERIAQKHTLLLVAGAFLLFPTKYCHLLEKSRKKERTSAFITNLSRRKVFYPFYPQS